MVKEYLVPYWKNSFIDSVPSSWEGKKKKTKKKREFLFSVLQPYMISL